jgi:hypothetical protein
MSSSSIPLASEQPKAITSKKHFDSLTKTIPPIEKMEIWVKDSTVVKLTLRYSSYFFEDNTLIKMRQFCHKPYSQIGLCNGLFTDKILYFMNDSLFHLFDQGQKEPCSCHLELNWQMNQYVATQLKIEFETFYLLKQKR